mmetsp:Transcript_15064/g.36168  ORF Transcript_15064/g.36168 Transcript_15064/m.36168 type:complete len:84 (-) Transcript_15064:176-427(-)
MMMIILILVKNGMTGTFLCYYYHVMAKLRWWWCMRAVCGNRNHLDNPLCYETNPKRMLSDTYSMAQNLWTSILVLDVWLVIVI